MALLSRSSCDETLKLIGSIEGVKSPTDHAAWIACDIGTEEDCKKAVAVRNGVWPRCFSAFLWAHPHLHRSSYVMQETVKHFGPVIHILINNAALFIFKSVEDATAEDWDRSAAVNIKGHALLTKASSFVLHTVGC